MARVSIQIGLRDKRALTRARELLKAADLRQEFGKLFGRVGQLAQRQIQKDLRESKRVRRRSGDLAKAIGSEAFFTESGLPAIRVGAFRGPAYARIQEEGGEILPRRAKALAIPLEPMLTPAGNQRNEPRELSLKFVPFRSSGVAVGALYPPKELEKARRIAKAAGRAVDLRDAKAYFLLVRKVNLKPRRWLSGSFRDQLPELVSELGKLVAAIMSARFQGRKR